MTLKIIFWVSSFVIFYTYIGYPFVLYIWSLLRTKEVRKSYIYPQVSIVIAALNEEKYIGRKIENLIDQDYPSERIEIVVVSDGSTDGTERIVKSYENKKVKLYSFEMRKGKASALNLAVSKVEGEIIVFTDTRQIFKRDAVKELIANFNDSCVGAVSGELFLRPENQNDVGGSFGFYWKYEKWIRKRESRIDSVSGATGSIYAMRRDLFKPISEDTILDDVSIPMMVVFMGHRVIFDELAVAYDDADISSANEMKRKIRTLTGNYQLLSLMPEILSFSKNRIFFSYISHKVTRLIIPFTLITLLLSNIPIAKGFYFYPLLLQVVCYLSALLGYCLTLRNMKLKYLSFPYTFVLLNYAAFLGFVNFIRKNREVWIKS